jgi:outer membrane protein TolC
MGRIMRLAVAAAVTASGLLAERPGAAQTPMPRPLPNQEATATPLPAERLRTPERPFGVDMKPLEEQGSDAPQEVTTPASPPTILDANVRPLDLNTALRLAGVQNPQLLIARQLVVESAAIRQAAAARILPSINLGMNYDNHTGNLQQSNGNILPVNRSAFYVGSGAGATAAGTVPVPGVLLEGNIAEAAFAYLASRQFVQVREYEAMEVRNQTFLQTTLAYSELLRAEGKRAISLQVVEEAKRIADLTAAYANAGQGRQADAQRAQTELQQRENDVKTAEEEVLVSSARLCYVLNVDPSIRLHPTDAFIVPHPVVPDPIPVRELIAMGLLQRPELKARQAAIRQSMLELEGAKLLPFSPTILIGFSGGAMGGGSNLVRPIFGAFGNRSDFDIFTYWTLKNCGIGNLAIINTAKARLGVANYQEIAVLDLVRAEVAEAYAKTHARFARIGISEKAVQSGTRGLREDLIRIENRVVPAIESVNSLNLLARARYAYLDSIIDYDRAQFELYVALGQPPADMLAHPAPTEGVIPPTELPALPGLPGEPDAASTTPNPAPAVATDLPAAMRVSPPAQ